MIANELMTENPRTLRMDETLGDAVQAMQSMEVRHLPVVDEQGDLVGIVSDRDLGRYMLQFEEGREAQEAILARSRTSVASIMSTDVASVDEDAELEEIVEAMLDHHVGAIPVVDGEGKVAGIVSYVDVLRAIQQGLSAAHEEEREGART